MGRFENKVALVTGGGSGIGRTTAIAFALEGANVLVGDISEHGGIETVQMIEEIGGTAVFVKMDVSKAEDHKMVVEKAISVWGRLDIAFNNAGIEGAVSPIGEHDDDAWHRVININLTGIYYAVKYQVPQMIKQGGGAIVNTASISGVVGSPRNPAYVASKHGVVGLTKSIAIENSSKGVRCNAIAPGVIQTSMLDRSVSPELQQRLLAGIPSGRLGTPEDIARAVLFLSSDESSYVTGHTLVADGALTVQ